VRIYSFTRGEVFEGALEDLGLPPIWIGPSTHPPLRLVSLWRRLQPYRPHVVQSFHGFANLYVGLVGRWLGALGVGALRGTLRHFEQVNGAWSRPLLRAPTGLVVNSRSVLQEIVRRGYLPGGRIFHLPNVIDLTEFDRWALLGGPVVYPESDRCTVMFVGRLVPQKRVDRFLRALVVAAQSGLPLTGVVVGDGPERSNMVALARTLGLSVGQVTFLGARSDVPALLARADMLVSCSDDEALPNVILEAMAARRPVITTPAGDAATVVADGVNGYVVPFDDVEGMGNRIARLAAAPRLRQRLGASGRRVVELRYSADGLADRILSIYRQIAEGLGERQAAFGNDS
jgi:glycosyltransferase involved in cell wall biosynthesis